MRLNHTEQLAGCKGINIVTGLLVIYGSKINALRFSRKCAKSGFAAANLLKKCFNPDWIHLFKFINENTRKICEMCLKLTIKAPERRHWQFMNSEKTEVTILNKEFLIKIRAPRDSVVWQVIKIFVVLRRRPLHFRIINFRYKYSIDMNVHETIQWRYFHVLGRCSRREMSYSSYAYKLCLASPCNLNET